MQNSNFYFLTYFSPGPIARSSLGTLSAIAQAILVGMLSFFTGCSLGHCLLIEIQS